MEVRWQISDGYLGGDRPQVCDVPDDELAECDTDEEREDLIASYIEEHFRQVVSWERL